MLQYKIYQMFIFTVYFTKLVPNKKLQKPVSIVSCDSNIVVIILKPTSLDGTTCRRTLSVKLPTKTPFLYNYQKRNCIVVGVISKKTYNEDFTFMKH